MKKSFLLLTSIVLISTLFGQTKKTINDYTTLVKELTFVKVQAEAIGKDIKNSWSSSKTSNQVNPALSDTTKTIADSSNNKKDSSNSTKQTRALSTALPEKSDTTKKDTTKLSGSSTRTKNAETNQNASVTRSKDSLLIQSKLTYGELQAAVEALIAQFQVIIKKPNLINDQFKKQIQQGVDSLNVKLNNFKTNYANGTLLLINGSGYTQVNVTVIGEIIEIGVSLYKAIRDIVKENRETQASDFKTVCSMKTWEELK